MYKHKLMMLSLLGASLLLVAGAACAGIIDACSTTCQLNMVSGSPPAFKFVCPDNDVTLDEHPIQTWIQGSLPPNPVPNPGFWVSITVKDGTGAGVPFIPGPDFWFIDCDPINDLYLCAGQNSTNADSATNALGQTTISNDTPNYGGCADGLLCLVQGNIIKDVNTVPPCEPQCLNIKIRTPDLFPDPAPLAKGDGFIDFDDYIEFGEGYPGGSLYPGWKCTDLDGDGDTDFDDYIRFTLHYPSVLIPDFHQCP